MDLIPSFAVDHTKIVPGIFESRVDTLGEEMVTTFDIRLKRPNREPSVDPAAMHTIEHVVATYLRNHPEWKDKLVYWGPMGCLTGNYLLVRGDYSSADLLPLMVETFRFVAEYEGEIPGAAPRDCGNWRLHDLPEARREAAKYLHEVLEVATEANLNYPAEPESFPSSIPPPPVLEA